jgi:UDP-N-acetyl-D-mannosaminuronic acid transferase (WecB/TagA/CpsF family)
MDAEDVRETVERVEAALGAGKGGRLGRATGALVDGILASATAARRSVYLLGEDAGALAAASVDLIGRFPGLSVSGSFRATAEMAGDEHAVTALGGVLRRAAPDLVLVDHADGDRLIETLRDELPRAWWIRRIPTR